MIKINLALLSDLGLDGMPTKHKHLLLRAIYSELEMRVGVNLTGRMSKQQVDEFEVLISRDGQKDDSKDALAWLEKNLPEYRNEVNSQFTSLCADIPELRDAILNLSAMYTDLSWGSRGSAPGHPTGKRRAQLTGQAATRSTSCAAG